MQAETTIRLGRKLVPPLAVPGEIFEVYQSTIGPNATLIWLNLRWLVHIDAGGDIEQILQQRTGLSFRDLTEALSALVEYGLLEIAETGEYVVNEPLSAAGYATVYGLSNKELAATIQESNLDTVSTAENAAESTAVFNVVSMDQADPDNKFQGEAGVPVPAIAVPAPEPVLEAGTGVVPEAVGDKEPLSPLSRRNRRRLRTEKNDTPATEPPTDSASKAETKLRRSENESRSADMDAVVQIYHKRIGMLGPTQFEKLQFWVEEQGMAGEVVALAIEETVRSAENPRIQYLEGILRNWFNDGIFTLQDLLKHKKASKVLARDDAPASPSMEGVPNAAAYRRVDPEMVKKWKELYPDEYDS